MATVSFDEKVIVRESKIVVQMRKDLDNTSSISSKRKVRTNKCTIEKAEQNARKWILK